jgi:hypothetical protein
MFSVGNALSPANSPRRYEEGGRGVLSLDEALAFIPARELSEWSCPGGERTSAGSSRPGASRVRRRSSSRDLPGDGRPRGRWSSSRRCDYEDLSLLAEVADPPAGAGSWLSAYSTACIGSPRNPAEGCNAAREVEASAAAVTFYPHPDAVVRRGRFRRCSHHCSARRNW